MYGHKQSMGSGVGREDPVRSPALESSVRGLDDIGLSLADLPTDITSTDRAILVAHARGSGLRGADARAALRKPGAVGRILASRRALAQGLRAAALSPTPLPPVIAAAYGCLGREQQDALKQAVRARELGDEAVLAFNGDWIADAVGRPTNLVFATSTGTAQWRGGGAPQAVAAIAGVDAGPRILVSNGYELWRSAHFHTIEPETIAWLRATLADGDVLFDIGANIGIVTLIALGIAAVRVVAFEPEPANHARLQDNLLLNDADAIALPIALADAPGIRRFVRRDPVAGATSPDPLNRAGGGPSVLAARLDDVAGLDAPTHLKIDVDGGERAVLAGASRTLSLPRLRHILVETGATDAPAIDALLGAHGFFLATAYPRDGSDIANRIYRR